MNPLIEKTAARFLTPLLVLFSVFVLLRGHDEPGGGFIGGLLTAAAVAIYGLAFGPEGARRLLRVDPRTLIGVGLLFVSAAAVAGPLTGHAILTGLWAPDPVPGLGKVSTVLLFDTGVHLAVFGTVILILLTLAEES
jgi:multicomponent Na+:H+ antiporter subunit B